MSHSSSFDDRLNSYTLPQPGPEYYAARRALWLSRPERGQLEEQPPIPPSVMIQKLAKALDAPGAVRDDRLWKRSLNTVWRNFSSGASTVQRLPMRLVVRIIHAAWLRDSTWPANAEAPEPDDELARGADSTKQAMPPLILKSSLGASARSQMTELD